MAAAYRTDGIFDTFKTVVNGLIDRINWIVEQPFNVVNWALDSIRGVEITDWYPFEWLPLIDVPQIPHLANGGLAIAPTLAMVGENKNAKSAPRSNRSAGKTLHILKLAESIIGYEDYRFRFTFSGMPIFSATAIITILIFTILFCDYVTE